MNKKAKQVIFFLMSFVITGSCYAASLNLVPVKNYSERISNLGLSILPPQGEDWYIITDNPNGGLIFTKTIDGPSHTFVCSFTVVPIEKDFNNPDKFLETVRQMQEAYTDKDRFKDIKSSYSLNERFGSFSVEYQINVTDVWRKTENGVPLIIKMHGYTFVHPKQSNYMVDIVYSERGSAENFTPSLQKVGRGFIGNLIIE